MYLLSSYVYVVQQQLLQLNSLCRSDKVLSCCTHFSSCALFKALQLHRHNDLIYIYDLKMQLAFLMICNYIAKINVCFQHPQSS